MWQAILSAIATIVAAAAAVYLKHRLNPPRPKEEKVPVESGRIHDVTFLMEQKRDDRFGMVITVDASLSNLEGIDCGIAGHFGFASGGDLRDLNGAYRDYNGVVALSTILIPSRRDQRFPNTELFMPYDELHLSPGTHDLSLYFRLYRHSDNETFATTTKYSWRYTQPEPRKRRSRF